jgi:hypothetical protein
MSSQREVQKISEWLSYHQKMSPLLHFNVQSLKIENDAQSQLI